jgi:DNA-directed RNA polymerase specialized sigma24 family protein
MQNSYTAERLDREWSRLRRCPVAVTHAAGWAIVEGPLHDLDQVLAAVGLATRSTPETECRMRQLVLLARHDALAARVAVQRLLPGLLAVVRRRRGEAEHVLDELLGVLWIVIRTFEPERRPSCMAAALISDADYGAFRSRWRRASFGEQPIGIRPDTCEAAPPSESARQIVLALLTEASQSGGGLSPADLELVHRTLDDVPTVEIARELDVTPRTVRNRRDRVTDRLREVARAA